MVTGAAHGIGRAVAERLADEGAIVCVSNIGLAAAHSTAQSICATGAQAVPLGMDVREEGAVAAAYTEVNARFGRLDIQVNCVDIAGKQGSLDALLLEDWAEAMLTNLTGTFLTCRGAIPLMRIHRWGRIINLSSIYARGQAGRDQSAYVASKAGLVGLSRVLANEVGPEGVTVNCIAHSPVKTATNAAAPLMGRLGEPSDITNAVAWFCSDEASFVTGTIFDVNGGAYMP